MRTAHPPSPTTRTLLDIASPKFGFPPKACPVCGQLTRVEAKGTAPKKSSSWRVTNAADGSQHSCLLRRRPLRPNTLTRPPVDPDVAIPDDVTDPDGLPVPLTQTLYSTRPYQRFRRYDGYDSQLHRGQSRHSAW